jgi:hypothetical protein
MPPSPDLTFDAHSIQMSSEKGKLFEHSLHTGFPQLGHSLVEVWELHREQILFFISIISALKAKNISHHLIFLIKYIFKKYEVYHSERDDII